MSRSTFFRELQKVIFSKGPIVPVFRLNGVVLELFFRFSNFP